MQADDLKVRMTNEMMLNIAKRSLERMDKDDLEHVMIQAITRDGMAELNFSIMMLSPDSDGSDDFYMETGNSINMEFDI